MKKKLLLIISVLLATAVEAQTVLTVSKDTKKVTTEQAGSYDSVKDEWEMMSDNYYMLCMPAALDGYYFGPEAKKQEIINCEVKEDETYVFTVKDMADLDDFKPNVRYLVMPDIVVDNIIHVTPGIQTKVEATPEEVNLQGTWAGLKPEIITGINTIQSDGVNKPAVIYDLEGRSVKSIRKGATYIINGKKVTIK